MIKQQSVTVNTLCNCVSEDTQDRELPSAGTMVSCSLFDPPTARVSSLCFSCAGQQDALLKEVLSTGADVTLQQVMASSDMWRVKELLLSSSYTEKTRHVLLLLKDAPSVIRMFEFVKGNALESPFTLWYVLRGEPTLQERLPPVLREGTSVAVCIPSCSPSSSSSLDCGNSVPVTEYTLITTTLDLNGNPFFVKVGKCVLGSRGLGPECELKKSLFQDNAAFFRDFRGRQLVVTTVDNWPFFKVAKLPNGTLIADKGIDVSVLNTLSGKLNFTYIVVNPPDGLWGVPLANGSIFGMIGQIARHEVDMAIDEITITGPRETVVDFTRPYFLESTTFITQAPQEKSRAYTLVRPFPFEVWLILIAAIVMAGPLMLLFTTAAHSVSRASELPRSGAKGLETSRVYSLETYEFNMYRIFVNQGCHFRNYWNSSRMFQATWYFFSITVYALYAGSVTSFLALPSFEEPLDSLQDLVDAHEEMGFQASLIRESSHEAIFKDADGGLLRDVWLTTSPEAFVDTPTEGVSGVLRNKYAYVHATMALKVRAVKFGKSKFHVARESFCPQGYGIVCRSGSPYKATFEDILIRLSEAGLVAKWANDELHALQGSSEEGRPRTVAITLEHLQAAFILMILGGTSAGLILLLEMLWAWLKGEVHFGAQN
ncbi:glutamate receptor ionotropic, delta-1-like [Oratosquilla oratoria]|uniref:glutamate receptor ionotropic, delta-1-like n=1 Tax=Oratosquilla oratoria TaxID=337810 RepID=UPI003F7752B9